MVGVVEGLEEEVWGMEMVVLVVEDLEQGVALELGELEAEVKEGLEGVLVVGRMVMGFDKVCD